MSWKELVCDMSLKSISQFLVRWMSDEGCIYILVFPNFEGFNLATIVTTILIEGIKFSWSLNTTYQVI